MELTLRTEQRNESYGHHSKERGRKVFGLVAGPSETGREGP